MKTIVPIGWQNDWRSFVVGVAEEYGKGLSDANVSKRFAGQEAEWSGVVREKRLNVSEGGATVRFDMPILRIELADGRRATVDSLIGRIGNVDDSTAWENVQIGATVQFRVRLASSGAFPAVMWAPLDESLGVTIITTDQCKLVQPGI